MNRERLQIMEKAKAKRRRRADTKSGKARTEKIASTETSGGITEKVIDFAQQTAAQVGALVKTAATKLTGAEEERRVRTSA